MNPMSPIAVLTVLSCGFGLAGCSQDNTDATAGTKGPTDDPCALVTDAEVGKSFPGAGRGKRDHSVDKYGISTCTWDSPTNMIVAQIFKAQGTAHDEVRSRMDGYVDPMKPGAAAHVEYVTIPGLGDEATISAVKADEARGILADGAVLAIRHGERMAVLFTHSLVDGETAPTTRALQSLGANAAARL